MRQRRVGHGGGEHEVRAPSPAMATLSRPETEELTFARAMADALRDILQDERRRAA